MERKSWQSRQSCKACPLNPTLDYVEPLAASRARHVWEFSHTYDTEWSRDCFDDHVQKKPTSITCADRIPFFSFLDDFEDQIPVKSSTERGWFCPLTLVLQPALHLI